eukprot:616894-Rhodomonas_salina.1
MGSEAEHACERTKPGGVALVHLLLQVACSSNVGKVAPAGGQGLEMKGFRELANHRLSMSGSCSPRALQLAGACISNIHGGSVERDGGVALAGVPSGSGLKFLGFEVLKCGLMAGHVVAYGVVSGAGEVEEAPCCGSGFGAGETRRWWDREFRDGAGGKEGADAMIAVDRECVRACRAIAESEEGVARWRAESLNASSRAEGSWICWIKGDVESVA